MKEKIAFDAIIEQFAGKPPVAITDIIKFMMDNDYTPEEWWEANRLLNEKGLMQIDNSQINRIGYSLLVIKRP
jgi:hypothetical protein